MNQDTVYISSWTAKSELLLKKIKKVLQQVGYIDETFPKSVFEDDKPISIVFVGQFSAGKSSIIKALTGNQEIEIGEGIKTEVTQPYDWNGIEVVDTPGIKTKIRPDHDEITYKAIANADMLVYVITEELFDDFVGNDFRKLLLDEDKAAEMILVVNKMADAGNTEEKRLVKLKELGKVTCPYSPQDLRTVFIDAESYLDSLAESDPELVEEYKKRSNYAQLVETLNNFVSDRGISSKLTTVLYKLRDILKAAMYSFQTSTGDTDVDAIANHLLEQRHINTSTGWRIESELKAIYESASSEIRDEGRSIANNLFACDNEESAEIMLEKAYNNVNIISEKCEKDIITKIEEITEDYKKQWDEFLHSDFSSSLQFRVEKRKHSQNGIFSRILESDWISRGSNKLISQTAGKNATASGLRAFSGSNAHEWVLNIGHYFGHNFKPWEAVKFVKKINIAGKALGVFGVVVSWGMQAKNDIDEDKRNEEIRTNREQLRACFNDAAKQLTIHYNHAMNEFINEYYHNPNREIDNEIMEINALRDNKKESYKLLETVHKECEQLISNIHKDCITMLGK